MKEIFQSASKITLLMLVLTLCVGVFLTAGLVETFKSVILMVIGFYFGRQQAAGSTDKPL